MKRIIPGKVSLVLFFLLMLQNSVFAQIIKPGTGVGKLKFGMSYTDAVALLGAPNATTNLEEETNYYVQYGYDLSKEVSFFIGFDQAVQYDNVEESVLNYPVYKLFFKNEKLVFMTLTSYGFSEELYSKFSLKKKVGFMTGEETLHQVFGEEDQIVTADDGSRELLYLSKGVEFTIDDGKLRAVHMFPPLSSGQKAEFLKAFN